MSVPLKATNFHTTERLLELALTMLESARREQNNEQLPANNWLTNNFTLEIIRAKVAANKANLSLTSRRRVDHHRSTVTHASRNRISAAPASSANS